MYQISASNITNINLIFSTDFRKLNPEKADPSEYYIPTIKSGGCWWVQNANPYNSEYTRCALVVAANNKDLRSTPVNGWAKVRPALTLSSSIVSADVKVGDVVGFGDVTWIVLPNSSTISGLTLNNAVICEDCIGVIPFRYDWKALDAYTYNVSTVREYLRNWLHYWKPDFSV